jgi:hypothetical protein
VALWVGPRDPNFEDAQIPLKIFILGFEIYMESSRESGFDISAMLLNLTTVFSKGPHSGDE